MQCIGSDRIALSEMWDVPVAAALTLLLGAGWIDAVVAVLCKVAWQVLFWSSCAIGETDVVTVVGLLSASHWKESVSRCVARCKLMLCCGL